MKKFIIKLSSYPWILKIAKKVFLYFPSLRYFLLNYAYGNNTPMSKKQYTSDFLKNIKSEIENRKLQKRVK
ncbi:MAG: hypothetical protein CSA86_02605 [Arcobacter sp.]|nr:MAG: hypothetical protein CSA86_02605 [Arcobacter sp.]